MLTACLMNNFEVNAFEVAQIISVCGRCIALLNEKLGQISLCIREFRALVKSIDVLNFGEKTA